MEQMMTSGGCANVFRFNLNTVNSNKALVIGDNVACFPQLLENIELSMHLNTLYTVSCQCET